MTDQKTPTTAVANDPRNQRISKAVLGPLTARDVTVIGAVLVIFIASVLPITLSVGVRNLWNVSGLYFTLIGMILPLSVGALFAVRRMSPEIKTRVGSLSIDQYASVVAVFTGIYFFLGTVTNFEFAYLVGLLGSIVLLAGTILAQWIPVFSSDFAGRLEIPAHVVARNAVPAIRRPAAPKPVLALPVGGRPPAQAAPSAASQPARPGAAWTSGQTPPPVHTAGGAIFTPAGTVTTQQPHFGGSAPQTPDVAVEPATQAVFTVGGSGVTETTAAEPATGEPTATAEAEPTAVASAAVVPEQGEPAPATIVNPKIVEAEPVVETIAATVDPNALPAVAADPFWFAVDRPQNVVDERTRQFAFKLTPGSWILALEDRGTSFLVQDSRGKTGVLYDLVGIERAPQGE